MADIFEKVKKNMGPLGAHIKEAHGYFTFPKLEGEIGPKMNFNGKEKLNWSLNNYLGLANHPEVRKADAEAAANYGMAYPMGARMMSGNSNPHEQLERELAAFVGKEDAIFAAAEKLAADLEAAGISVMLDDRRGTSPGVKFKDAELIGIPVIVVVGKALEQGNVEVRVRRTGEKSEVPVAQALTAVTELLPTLP